MHGRNHFGKASYELSVVGSKPKELPSDVVTSEGTGKVRTFSTLAGSGLILSLEKMCPRYATLSFKKALLWLWAKTDPFQPMKYFCQMGEMLFKGLGGYQDVITANKRAPSFQSCQIICIRCWNVASALHRPKGIQVNSNSPC